MRLAVKFNDQLCRVTHEIGDGATDGNLPAEAEAIDVVRLQIAPQQSLGASHHAAQRFCAIALLGADGSVRHVRPPPSLALPHKGGGNRLCAWRVCTND